MLDLASVTAPMACVGKRLVVFSVVRYLLHVYYAVFWLIYVFHFVCYVPKSCEWLIHLFECQCYAMIWCGCSGREDVVCDKSLDNLTAIDEC